MLNPALKAIYTPNVIEKLEVFAADMEKEGRRVLVCFPTEYPTIIYPGTCFIDNADYDESGAIVRKYLSSSWVDEVSGDDNSCSPSGTEMYLYDEECEGVELWVK